LVKPQTPSLSLSQIIPIEIPGAAANPDVINPEKILANIDIFGGYQTDRNFPALDKTTRLSAHLKFGTCSVRQVYHQVKTAHGSDHELVRALFWRDFFTHIAWHFPYVFRHSFRHQYRNVHWSGSTGHFESWCRGSTGFPIIDAGMRELNATGFMHNRVRMIAASFLIKDLQIDWRQGENYFRQQLVDYDPCVNNGNWQWVASTGCDAQPWFRIFNPWVQQKKFDAECIYIKKWIPELRSLEASQIHSPYRGTLAGYPAPLIDHALAVVKTRQIYGQ
jgi:deoxyribodipyrimidine photo-lyase